MSEVKRYGFRIGMPERGNVETILSVEDHIGEYVKYEDYEKLKAQLERAEKVLKYIAQGNDHWAEAEQIAAREYFKEKEQR